MAIISFFRCLFNGCGFESENQQSALDHIKDNHMHELMQIYAWGE